LRRANWKTSWPKSLSKTSPSKSCPNEPASSRRFCNSNRNFSPLFTTLNSNNYSCKEGDSKDSKDFKDFKDFSFKDRDFKDFKE